VRSLLSPDGIRFMLTSPVANFLGFTGVGVILVAMIGVGPGRGIRPDRHAGAQAGRHRAAVDLHLHDRDGGRAVVDRGRRGLSGAGAAGGGGLPQHGPPSAGRSCGGFSGVAAVFLVNVFVTPTDALLVEVTNDASRGQPSAQISVVGNLFFMIASSILMGIICTVLTERFVEPRLGAYTGGVPVEKRPACRWPSSAA
jgi:aminobenzoyl-glutamate transport protein